MKNCNKYFALIFIINTFLSSCNNSVVHDLQTVQDLRSFFQSDDIDISIHNHDATITIKDAQILEEQSDVSEGEKAAILEQFASLGALIASNQLIADHELDSLLISLKSSIGNATYGYSSKSLIDIKKDSKIITSFLNSLADNDYDKSSNFLSSDITSGISKENFSDFLKRAHLDGRIKDVKLVGFIVTEGQYGLYENVFFENGTKQTYVFVFRDNENKIAGINHVK